MPIVEVRGLRKRYGARTVVDDVSFTVDDGEIFGIVVTGTDETVQALLTLYAGRHLIPAGLRIVEATFDDAFLSIVGAGRG